MVNPFSNTEPITGARRRSMIDKNAYLRSSKPVKIYKRLPKGYELVDVARSLEQAKSFSYPANYKVIIVKTYSAIGNASVFPYHLAKRKGVD